jgi:hypothetical protein
VEKAMFDYEKLLYDSILANEVKHKHLSIEISKGNTRRVQFLHQPSIGALMDR